MNTIILQSIYALIATLGFGIIFNIHGKNLFFATIGGGISWFFYLLGLKFNFTTTATFFFSSVIFSVYSEILARKLKTPVTTLVVCALIPLVPGSGMYYTMYQAVTGDIMHSLELGLNTLANAGALALGIICVSTITTQYYKVKNKTLRKYKKTEK